ncbi:hypothetical protein [Alteromonas sp. a30]|uniref:hypothetical protein n=1 Tax=Alteromonas sp. a30 TaxID=2730917 RepID=UPI0022818810|nr:hypothetical protein [Alteromonas sp. a30]MCY7295264.1 hypothetical protein [Alteromonas sp. a30]
MKSTFPIRLKCGHASVTSAPSNQRGSMLFISVFVIVVLGMLGMTLTNILSTSEDSVVYESLGLRALNAARSGLDIKIADAFPLLSTDSEQCDSGPSNVSFNNIAGLEGCSYTAICQSDNSINGINYFRFSSTGVCVISDVVVSRTVAVDARKL